MLFSGHQFKYIAITYIVIITVVTSDLTVALKVVYSLCESRNLLVNYVTIFKLCPF